MAPPEGSPDQPQAPSPPRAAHHHHPERHRHRRKRRKKSSSRIVVPYYRWWYVLVAIAFGIIGTLLTLQMLRPPPSPDLP